ncbi:hypothetical protein [Candidatus Phytoplasma sp. AldY-WA1]|uniref:hypothetical protein n=1 Tax=Candidatus Phytoplasma sp. AldY-WA1 TaxID=2852100 RepID=UPI00254C443C|nr:hypothetical protein [Candidatus Phytoplasma sp. AldY-WA1]
MPKLIKFFLSNKKLFLFLLYYIYIYVHLAIIIGSNFNFKLKENTEIKIKLLNKKDYLNKYKNQDPIENKKIHKDNIIFSSKEDIDKFFKKKWDSKLSLDDLNKNKFIVDYYNKKYNNENLSYICFIKENDNSEKVLLFWNIKKEITIDTKELKDITSFKTNLSHFEKNLVSFAKPLYYQDKQINDIYFNPNYFGDICFDDKKSNEENYSIKIFSKILSSDSYKQIFCNSDDTSNQFKQFLSKRKEVTSKYDELNNLNKLSPKKITFFTKTS